MEIPPQIPPQQPSHTPPPVYQQPPSKGSRTALWVVLGIFCFGCLVGTVMLVMAGNWFRQQANKKIKEPALSGKPSVVSKKDNGWAQYNFPEGPLTVELPAKPEIQHLTGEEMEGDSTSKIAYDNMVMYTGAAEATSYLVAGYWMTPIGMTALEEETFYSSFMTGMKVTGGVEAKGSTSSKKLFTGMQSTAAGPVPASLVFSRFKNGFWVVAVYGTQADTKEFRRIVDSIQ